MTVTTLASRRRHPDFDTAAEAVTPFGFAIGLPDDAGKPQVMATVTPVKPCSVCRCDMPTSHSHHGEVTPDDAA